MCYENSLGVLGMVTKIEERLEFGTGIAGGVETRSAWSARGEKEAGGLLHEWECNWKLDLEEV